MPSKKSERPTAKKSVTKVTKKAATKFRAAKRAAKVDEERAPGGTGGRTPLAASPKPAEAKKRSPKKAQAAKWPLRLASKYASKYAAAALARSAAVWCRAGVSRRDFDNFLTAKEAWVEQLLRPRGARGLGV
jgi:hypothetical protein